MADGSIVQNSHRPAGGVNASRDRPTPSHAPDNTTIASNFLRCEQNDSHGPVEQAQFSAQQVRTMLAGLFTALRCAVSDERNSPEERLRRASAILQDVEGPPQRVQEYVRGGLAPWQVRRVISFIDTNLDSPIRSASLAGFVRLTPCHFSRAFRHSFGDSPIEYVIRRRIERAQALMLSTDASLIRIALDCGFADQAHLCRLFRRIVGESPGTWRRARISPRS